MLELHNPSLWQPEEIELLTENLMDHGDSIETIKIAASVGREELSKKIKEKPKTTRSKKEKGLCFRLQP